jgi:hypothetical protein
LSFDSWSTLFSAVGSLISVAIAAYLVIQGKREAPDIRFVSVPVSLDSSFTSQTDYNRNRQLLFQNVGARAGSLIGVTLISPLAIDSGSIIANVDSYQRSGSFPVVVQPYSAILVDVNVIMKGNPNLKTLLVNLGADAKVGVRYLISTKPKRNATTGIQERLDYFGFKFEYFEVKSA